MEPCSPEAGQSDGELWRALERSIEPLVITGDDGAILWINNAGAQRLGEPVESLTGKPLASLSPAGPIPTGGGMRLHRIGAASEEALEEYRRVRARSSDIVYRMDLQGTLVSVTTGIEVAGTLTDQWLGRPVSVFVDPESLEVMRAALASKEAGEEVTRYEVRIRGQDGQAGWLDIESWLVFSDGVPVFVQGIARDITERKRVEARLASAEARLRQMLDAIPTGIWAYDGVDVIYANQALSEMSHRSREWLLQPDAFGELVHPDDREAMVERGRARLRGEAVPKDYEIRAVRGDGEIRSWSVSAELTELDGKPVSFIAVLDITDQKREQEARRLIDAQLQQAQKLESLGVLAGGIAHDFNNLLTAILGNASLALLDLPRESPALHSIEAIELAARRAAELTREMLAYAGRATFVSERLNLSSVVEEMTHLLEVAITKRAAVKYRFAPDLPAIEADPAQIRQVVMNLITNASDAIGESSGVITITTSLVHADRHYLDGAYLRDELAEGDYVSLEVSDTGTGMDEDTMKRIFDPFFTTKFAGRGLGLAAVLGIIRAHRGAIKIYSEPGAGTTFRVLLPVADGAVASAGGAVAPGRAAEPRLRGRVLLADDDRHVRAVTRATLERLGLTVATAGDGEQAVAAAVGAEEPFDVILLDMTMPVMSGDETYRELRRLGIQTPIVFMSGYTESDMRERFAGRDVAGFVQKPFELASLRQVIATLLNDDPGS